MPSNVEAWTLNLKAKVEELRILLLQYLTTKDDKDVEGINHQIFGLQAMFAQNQVPEPLTTLQSTFKTFRESKRHPPYFDALIRSYTRLHEIAAFAEHWEPSFDEIFESFKADEELQALADELVNLLNRVLSEADDILTANVARDLRVILDQLKARNRYSLYELQNWVDLGVRTLIMVGETATGTHGVGLVYEAAKIANRVGKRLFKNFQGAQEKLLEQRSLKFTKKAMEHIPAIQTDEDEVKYLKPPSADTI